MADTTRAAAPGKTGDKEGTIFGLPIKTAVIVGAVVIVGGYLYIKYHSSQSSSQGQGGGQGGGQKGPTGTSRQTLTVWVRQHGGHRGRK